VRSEPGASPSAPPAGTAAAAGRRIPGEEGIWVLVLVDMTVFVLFFATSMYRRGRKHEAFASDHGSLSIVLGTVNRVMLLTSSLVVAIAVHYVLSSRHRHARILFGAALACGLGFIAVKALEWSHLLMAGKWLLPILFLLLRFHRRASVAHGTRGRRANRADRAEQAPDVVRAPNHAL